VSGYYLVLDGVYMSNSSNANPAVFTTSLSSGTRYRVSLRARKGDYYSPASSPAFSCIAE